MTAGIFTYEFYKNIKLFSGFIGTGNEPFQLNVVPMNGTGAFADAPTLKPIASLGSKRDYANGGNPATILTMAARNDNGVYLRAKFGPVNLGEDAGVVGLIPQERLIAHFAEQVGLEARAYIQQFLVGAAKAAIAGMTSTLHTYAPYVASPGTKVNMSPSVLVAARQKLGDKAAQWLGPAAGGCWVIRSEQELDLFNGIISSNLYGVVDGVVKNASAGTLGVPYITVDDDNLTGTATFAHYYGLGLGSGFARVTMMEPKFYVTDQRLEYETVANILRADLDFYIDLPGFQWDKVNGGANPDLATVATSANWLPTYSDHREVKGVLMDTNSSVA